MFTIDSDQRVSWVIDPPEGQETFHDQNGLACLVRDHPGAWAVKLWNQLPGVTPINTPKFRNRQTAVERIWNKLAELYPDAILPEDMPTHNERRNRPRRTKAPAKRRLFKTPHKATGDVSKRDQAVQLLRKGATLDQLCKKTGWKPAAVQGVLQWISWVTSQNLKRLTHQPNGKGIRVYRAA
jgi:hypothetical protein